MVLFLARSYALPCWLCVSVSLRCSKRMLFLLDISPSCLLKFYTLWMVFSADTADNTQHCEHFESCWIQWCINFEVRRQSIKFCDMSKFVRYISPVLFALLPSLYLSFSFAPSRSHFSFHFFFSVLIGFAFDMFYSWIRPHFLYIIFTLRYFQHINK